MDSFLSGWYIVLKVFSAFMGVLWSFLMKKSLVAVIFLTTLCSCGKYLAEAVESPEAAGGKATFRLRNPSASTVQVAGDWNNWGRGDAESGEVLVGLMEKGEKGGLWSLTVELPPGRYRYRYIIDETRAVLDPFNPRIVEDHIGGKANLLIMP